MQIKRLSEILRSLLKMATRGRRKSTVDKLSQKNAIFNYFQPSSTRSEAEKIVATILNDIVTDSVTDSTFIASQIVNDIVDNVFHSRKPAAHSGNRVSKKTFNEWKEKFPWLIFNIKCFIR